MWSEWQITIAAPIPRSRALGDLGGARQLHEQTLAGSRRVLGDDHPDTLASMNNLAAFAQELERL